MKIPLKIQFHYKKNGYNIKQSDGEVPVKLELWQMQSKPSLPSLLSPLWAEKVLSMGQI